MDFVEDDGGRAVAGYTGDTGDCLVRAICIIDEKPYKEVYDLVNEFCKDERNSKRRSRRSNARTGVHKATAKRILHSLGFNWTPTMFIGSGCKIHLKAEELPTGKLIAVVSKHWTAVIDGTIHDTYDPSRVGTRCVYGYWKK